MLHLFRRGKNISVVKNYVSHEKKKKHEIEEPSYYKLIREEGREMTKVAAEVPCSMNVLWLQFNGK